MISCRQIAASPFPVGVFHKFILPEWGAAFYINGVIFGFSHGREPLQLLRFLRFAHGCLYYQGGWFYGTIQH